MSEEKHQPAVLFSLEYHKLKLVSLNYVSVIIFFQCIIRDQPSVKKLDKR